MSDPLPPPSPKKSRKADDSPKKANQKSGRSVGGLVTRIAVWGGLLVLVGVVLFDVRARRAAQTTADAWSRILDERNGKDQDLMPSELKAFVTGSPTVRTLSEAEMKKYVTYDVEDYVWSGPFREHVVRVVSDRGSFVRVARIESPGNE